MLKQSPNTRDAGKSVPSGPAPLDVLFPTWMAAGFMGACQRGGTAAEDSCKLAEEWIDFVAQRMKKDVDLLGRLARSQSPMETYQLYSDHWRDATSDYWKEFGKISTMNQSVAAAIMSTTAESGGSTS